MLCLQHFLCQCFIFFRPFKKKFGHFCLCSSCYIVFDMLTQTMFDLFQLFFISIFKLCPLHSILEIAICNILFRSRSDYSFYTETVRLSTEFEDKLKVDWKAIT